MTKADENKIDDQSMGWIDCMSWLPGDDRQVNVKLKYGTEIIVGCGFYDHHRKKWHVFSTGRPRLTSPYTVQFLGGLVIRFFVEKWRDIDFENSGYKIRRDKNE